MKTKAKGWEDLKCLPDKPDLFELQETIERCSESEQKFLFKSLSEHHGYPKIETIQIKKIKPTPFQDRLDLEVSEKDREEVGNNRLTVVYSKESDAYIIIKGKRCFHQDRREGTNEFICKIIGEVEFDYSAIILRGDHVLDYIKPFHILEKTMFIFEANKIVISRCGAKNIFSWGGNRRSMDLKKYSMISLLKKELPYKASQIDTLKRLSGNIGSLAIEGLYSLLISSGKELSLSRIHRINPEMNKMGLREEIEKMIKDMKANGKNKDEIKEKVAIIAYDVLFEKRQPDKKQVKQNTPNPDDGEKGDSGEEQDKQNPVNNKKSGDHIYKDIASKDFKKIREAFDGFTGKVKYLESFFNGKKELNASETETLQKMGKEIENSWGEFWILFLKVDI
jgi:hypothetical protein